MDKFTYNEGEMTIVECQCELCKFYNNGERSEECPKDMLEDIISGNIFCPAFKKKVKFELD